MRKSSCAGLQVESGRSIPPGGFWCNFGPRVHTRSLSINESLLGDTEKSIAWPLGETVGIWFEKGVSPRVFIEKLLRKEGFTSPEDLRRILKIPSTTLVCQNNNDIAQPFINVRMTDDPTTVLRQALILGLCGPDHYDPNMLVIWTDNRLWRQLDLFVPGRFYADN